MRFAIGPFGGATFGAVTLAMFVKKASSSTSFIYLPTITNAALSVINWHQRFDAGDRPALVDQVGISQGPSGGISGTTTWYLLVITRAAGSGAARFHIHNGTSWAHTAGTNNSLVAQAIGATDRLYVPAPASFAIGTACDLMGIGIKKSDSTDLQVETLLRSGPASWLAYGFDWLVIFDNIATRPNAANPGSGDEVSRTAVTLVTDPPGWSAAPAFVPQIIWLTPAASSGAVAAPTYESSIAYASVANRPAAGGSGGLALGYNTKGTLALVNNVGQKAASKFTLAAPTTLTELHAWVGNASDRYCLFVYSDVAGVPTTRLAYTSPITSPGGDAEISQSGFSVPLAAGDYWIGYTCEGAIGKVFYDASIGTSATHSSGATFSPPAAAFEGSYNPGSRNYSVWAVTGSAAITRPFASSAALTGALNAAAPGDLVQYTGAGILDIPGNYTGFAGRRNSGYVNVDLGLPGSANHVRFTGGGGAGLPAVGIYNSQYLRIYGGEITNPPPKSVGHDGLHIYGAGHAHDGSTNHVVWWNLVVHDTVDCGIKMLPNVPFGGSGQTSADNTIADCDIEATVYMIGRDKTVDTHPEQGTGQHCCLLADTDPAGATYPSFLRNRVAIDGYNTGLSAGQGGGSIVEFGFNDALSTISGCTLILRGNNTLFNAQQQTAGNGLNLWGDAAIGCAVPFLQHSNATGSAVNNYPPGQNRSGVVVAYGRHSSTNRNAYEGTNPWQIGPTYRDVA